MPRAITVAQERLGALLAAEARMADAREVVGADAVLGAAIGAGRPSRAIYPRIAVMAYARPIELVAAPVSGAAISARVLAGAACAGPARVAAAPLHRLVASTVRVGS